MNRYIQEKYIQTNGVLLHALDHPGGEPTLVYLPGLTANARLFDGVAQAGVTPRFRILALDLRGRGLSDKPESSYTMADHAADVIGVLDAEGIEQATLVGHSFGGLLSLYLAANYPDRVERIVIIDAAKAAADPKVAEMIRPSLDRLGTVLPSVDAYIAAMKQMPFLDDLWDDSLEAYFQADMQVNDDGTAQAHATPAAIGAVIDGILEEDWEAIINGVICPAVLINATDPYGPPGSPPILTETDARETAAQMANCQYIHVPGNHVTMVFGKNAKQVAKAITEFITGD
ncbi:MAG: alpha/beta hydrolase [Chloroflexi bacterium]|nr:alpha/beta hydrolase [Chloroflexota bacterium]